MTTIKEPLVSIIVPVYNVDLYIDACLNSIKHQTYRNIEIIVVEDCSTDNSRQVLQPHLKDDRIKLVQHEKNSGLSAARNTGIESATGEYMMFVDSDDIVDSRLVAACVECAIKKNAEVVTYGFTPFEDGLEDTELPYLAENLVIESGQENHTYFDLPHFAWLKFTRSSVVRSASLHFPVDLYYEDWPFHWHLGLSTKIRYELPNHFYLYRQRGTSITGSTGNKLLDLFVIHSKVMSLVQDYQADEVKKILANKVRQSHWSILTRIDDQYLSVALTEAKNAEKLMELCKYESTLNLRNNIITTIVNLPSSMALTALKILRKALKAKAALKAR